MPVSVWEEWLAWWIVRDRERELERRRLLKEAEAARSGGDRRGETQVVRPPASDRRAA